MVAEVAAVVVLVLFSSRARATLARSPTHAAHPSDTDILLPQFIASPHSTSISHLPIYPLNPPPPLGPAELQRRPSRSLPRSRLQSTSLSIDLSTAHTHKHAALVHRTA